ncbi:hypothetical protein E3T55_07610 [Cryobacterium frigoriphilum]|uniref:Uncharacterized protein n=1 Tax=Cryobacterium frigoriphilum TaxID=1259150 RepID=A0A4R9A3M1_9MICO|nr:hypothetical protein [Cryobacterium frigoriphilum]TFD51575.1 hypothetical protein E3T55_07610 [Cryobacterium frigoriphilum]
MPWWSWLLIWSGLVLGLITMFVLFGVTLFRKLMTLAEALGKLGDRFSEVGAPADDEVPSPRALPAVFQSRSRLAELAADRRFERLHRRQLRRDRAIDRGKLFRTSPVIPKDSSHA